MSRKLTTEQFIEKARKVHGNKYGYSLVKYADSHTKIKIICKKHGIFEQRAKHHLAGSGCSKCLAEKNKDRMLKTDEQVIDEFNFIHGNEYDYSLVNYNGAHENVDIICPKHGLFKQRAKHHLAGSKCPKCNYSKGEQKIRDYLINNDILFEEQKRFVGCRNKQPLPFDFYLPIQNVCIEFDGEQHFKPIKYWRSSNYLNEIQKHDKIKTNYCKKNNIKLIRISYKKINQIEAILNENS